jgi:hypothetical protein
MLINVVIIILIGLIAYWWSNQGFLSALLHLVCVITAASLALAWWEPIVVDNLLTMSWWSGLMPGTAMLITFIVALAILRMVSDKLAFGNTQLPRPIDMVGGGVLGAISGVLTVGLLLVGVGLIDQPAAILGHVGWGRNLEGQIDGPAEPLWLPVDAWTVGFLETLSVGSLHPDLGGRPLAEWNPGLDQLAGLLRDRKSTMDNASFAQMIQPPGSIDISAPVMTMLPGGGGRVMMVPLHFETEGMDFGNRLALASSQIRLVGESNGETTIEYPKFWGQLFKRSYKNTERFLDGQFKAELITEAQKNAELSALKRQLDGAASLKVPGLFEFESTDSYITESDERNADIRLLFLIPDDFEARFIQVRGTRFDLEEPTEEPDWGQFCIRSNIPNQSEGRVDPWGGDISGSVTMRGRLLRGSRPSQSHLKGDVDIHEGTGRIVRANAVRYPNSARGSGKLGVRGYVVLTQDPTITDQAKLIADKGRGIVKIAVGPTTNANILAVSRFVGGDGDIVLLDKEGNEYAPRGFELRDSNNTTVTFNTAIRRWSDVTHRPRFGSQDLFTLIFVVPVDTTLDRLELGDEVVGLFENVLVEPPSSR